MMHSRDVKQKQLTNCKGAVEIQNHCSSLSKKVYCVNIACSVNTLYYQLTHTTLKNVELLKHSKIDTPLQGKSDFIHLLSSFVFIILNYHLHIPYISFITVTICSHNTDDALHIFHASTVNQTCNF